MCIRNDRFVRIRFELYIFIDRRTRTKTLSTLQCKYLMSLNGVAKDNYSFILTKDVAFPIVQSLRMHYNKLMNADILLRECTFDASRLFKWKI